MEGMDEFADDGGVPSPDRMEDEEPAENWNNIITERISYFHIYSLLISLCY
jgi:hypothetical protein